MQGEGVVENQLIEPLEAIAGTTQHWNIELLPVVGDDEVGSHELAEALPHFRHRRRTDQVPVGVAVHVRGLRRDGAGARHQGLELIHHDVVPDPYRGNLDDLGRFEIEVAGLDVEGDEIVEVGLQVAGMDELKRLEQPERQSTVRALAGSEYHVISGGHLMRREPVGVGYPGPSEHGDQRDLDPAARLDPDSASRGDALRQALCQRGSTRIERRLAQVVMVLLQGIASGADGTREQLVHQAGERLVRPAHPPQVLQVIDQTPHAPAIGVSFGALTGKGPEVAEEVLLPG